MDPNTTKQMADWSNILIGAGAIGANLIVVVAFFVKLSNDVKGLSGQISGFFDKKGKCNFVYTDDCADTKKMICRIFEEKFGEFRQMIGEYDSRNVSVNRRLHERIDDMRDRISAVEAYVNAQKQEKR